MNPILASLEYEFSKSLISSGETDRRCIQRNVCQENKMNVSLKSGPWCQRIQRSHKIRLEKCLQNLMTKILGDLHLASLSSQ